jgi:hypothetical protein
MKKTIVRYGLYAASCELISFVLAWLILTVFTIGITAQGYLGWVAILCPLIFIYFGIRYYRDCVNNSNITFLSAIKVGLLIMIMPALFYAFIETIYVFYIDPKFYQNIYLREVEEYRKTLSATQLAEKIKEMKQEMVFNNNPLYNFSAIAMFIAACGTIITLISALVLRRELKPVAVNAEV